MRLLLKKINRIVLFLLFPLVQSGYLIWILRSDSNLQGVQTIFYVLGIIFSVIGDFFAFRILFIIPSKEKLDSKEKEIKQFLSLSRQTNIECAGYLTSVSNEDSLFKEMVSEVLMKADWGKYDEALLILSEFSNTTHQNDKTVFCDNKYVNAIILDKAEICAKESISFSSSVNISTHINIEPATLCSVFGNLLDNAINSCRKYAEGEKRIELRAGVKGEYLLIYVDNSADASSQKEDTSKKHYGMKIVEDHVNKHGGHFFHEFDKESKLYHAEVAMIIGGAGE